MLNATQRRFASVALVALVGVLVAAGGHDQAQALRQPLPSRLLWAWERPTDLSSLPPGVGVAYLAGTIRLSGNTLVSRPRLQLLAVPPLATVVAVVRIESDTRRTVAPTPELEDRTAHEVVALCGRSPGIAGVQIDFDATVGDRPFYGPVLARLRRLLPPAWSLSITALASWCLGDPWIRDLPIDDAVPMLFRMGRDAQGIRARIEAGQDFTLPVCRASLGVSLDEPLASMPASRRLYVFSPAGWNAANIARATGRLGPE